MSALENILKLRKANVPFDLLIESVLPWIFSSEYLAEHRHIITFKEVAKNNPELQSIVDQQRQLTALKAFDSRVWSKKTNSPSLVIAATNDIISLASESRQLANNLSARFVEISGGHASPVE